jgi:hypothetical protein
LLLRSFSRALQSRPRWGFSTVACAAILLPLPIASHAQDLEPRAYSASPVGTNFIVASYTRLDGQVLTDPSLPITDVQAKIDLQTLGYVRTFGLAGHAASLAFLAPFAQADVSGKVFDAPNAVHRAGPGDARLRLAVNLIGAPALSPREFAQRQPTTTVGASLTVVAPTGQYTPSRLINVGSNRWAFKPEIGISQPLGKWFAEASAGVWLYTDNNDFFGGQRRSQDPLSVLQLHVGYNLRPGLWLAADAGHYAGGRTQTNGIYNQDRQENKRYGLTLSVPLETGWSTKLSWSNGFATRAGGDFKVISVALQYRWFDR